MIKQIRRQHAQGSEIYIVTNTYRKDSPDVEKFLELVGLDRIIPKERRFYDAWQPLREKAEYIAECDMNEFYDDSPEVLRTIARMQRNGHLNSNVKLYIVFPENSRTPKHCGCALCHLAVWTRNSHGESFFATCAVKSGII